MNQLLSKGQKVKGETSGADYVIEAFLGGGGQGEVYKAKLGPTSMALKWYFPEQATGSQKSALSQLVSKGPPNDQFLWPVELVRIDSQPSFGYVMPLRDPKYIGIVDLMKRRAEPTFLALANAGRELAHGFLQLHSSGFCYCDISFGNVFFDPQTGSVLICDNDNVIVNGEKPPIYGTMRFMAPEIVSGKALPSTDTDLFSLAVLLFYMFHIQHAFDGALESALHALDAAAMNKLYGTDAVFIYDPANTSNRPVKGLHDNAISYWPIYPTFLRDMFTRSFTQGIKDPAHGRVRESEWRAAMARLRDSIVPCQHCGAENFYDIEVVKQSGGQISPCWSCAKQITVPPRIRIEKQLVMLNANTQLFPHHVNDHKMYDYSKAIAVITQNPANPSQWGLKNTGDDKWVVTLADGALKDVEPGRSVSLSIGTKINFGHKTGEIRA